MTAPDQGPAAAFAPLLDRIVTDQRPPTVYSMPGAVFGVATLDGSPTIIARGTDARDRPVVADGLFPIASASKLATALVVLRLADDGAFALDTPLGAFLSDARAALPGVTVERLLSHTSGLPLDVPDGAVAYGPDLDWPTIARAALAVAPSHEPGRAVQYSNVAYYLLGLAAERLTGQSLGDLLKAWVFAPLGIEAYYGAVPAERAIAVGDVDSAFVGTALEPCNTQFSWSLGMPSNSVQTNAAGLLALVQAYLGRGGIIRPETAARARSNVVGDLPGGWRTTDAFIGFRGSRAIAWQSCAWGLGVEVQGGKRPHWAPATAPRSFGHIGSSGCLAWCDPSAGAVWCVLGTRTTDSGWLVRHGTAIARAAAAAVSGAAGGLDVERPVPHSAEPTRDAATHDAARGPARPEAVPAP